MTAFRQDKHCVKNDSFLLYSITTSYVHVYTLIHTCTCTYQLLVMNFFSFFYTAKCYVHMYVHMYLMDFKCSYYNFFTKLLY